MSRAPIAAALALLGLFAASPGAGAVPTSAVTVDSTTVASGTVTVRGRLLLGLDALGPTQVGADGAGDVSASGAGLDVGNALITPDLVARRLTFTLKTHDGTTADGIAPAAGYVWPFTVDGSDRGAWLAAGTTGSNFPPKTAKWFELCYTTAGSYYCGNALTGSMNATQTTWTVPFNRTAPPAHQIRYGSKVEPGSTPPGAPGSVLWAVALFNGNATDTVAEIEPYTVPGRVDAGIARAGTPESAVTYNAEAQFDPGTGAYSAPVPRPAGTGAFTVYVRSCFGAGDGICVRASYPVTL